MFFLKPFKKMLRRPIILFGIAALIIALLIIGIGTWTLYNKTSQLLDANLRERLLSIVTTAVVEFDSNDVEQLQIEGDWLKPEWARVVSYMEKVRKNNANIIFMYIFRKTTADPTKMEFVADSHSIYPYAKIDINNDGVSDEGDQLQWPGQPYETAPVEAFEAYDGPTTNRDIYSDQWGPVLTGYAPIKNRDGDTVAVLAVDIKAGDFSVITRQTLYPFLIFISFLVFIILSLFYFIIRMWSRRLMIETAQREQIEKLLGELGKSNDKLWVANEKLKDLDVQKTEFVSMASHQLRSPLTAIKGYSSMVLEGSFGPVSDKVREAVDRVFQSSQKLVMVIEDFLNISRIELGTMKYEWSDFDLREVAETVVRDMKQAIEKNDIKLTFDYDTNLKYLVHGDSGKLTQVISNLIDNASKYTKQGSIKVSLEKKVNKVQLSVKDTGIGIASETMPKLFAKFSRATDASKTNITGTGLGLYVAKQIIEAHKGKIWAESEGVGKGSMFIVEL